MTLTTQNDLKLWLNDDQRIGTLSGGQHYINIDQVAVWIEPLNTVIAVAGGVEATVFTSKNHLGDVIYIDTISLQEIKEVTYPTQRR